MKERGSILLQSGMRNIFLEVFDLKITDLIIDPRSLGETLWLVGVSPAYEYRNNRRTDKVTGYRYTVAMVERGLEKINVKIDGEQMVDEPNGYIPVEFEGLEVYIYWSLGQPAVGARAKGIRPIDPMLTVD